MLIACVDSRPIYYGPNNWFPFLKDYLDIQPSLPNTCLLQLGSVPVTNIDDIAMSVSENNITTINIGETSSIDDQQANPESGSTSVDSLADVAPVEPQLIATIKLSGDDSTPTPTKQSSATTSVNHHTNGGRNSNQPAGDSGIHSQAESKTDSNLAVGTEANASHSLPDNSANNSKYQQKTSPSSTNSPVVQYSDPPLKRFTAYGQPAIGKEKKSKECCIIS